MIISQHWSSDKRRMAQVSRNDDGYLLEYFRDEKKEFFQDQIPGDWTLNSVEDIAEAHVL